MLCLLMNCLGFKQPIPHVGMPVPSAAESSPTRKISEDIIWFTLGRNPSIVLCAPILLDRNPAWSRILLSNTGNTFCFHLKNNSWSTQIASMSNLISFIAHYYLCVLVCKHCSYITLNWASWANFYSFNKWLTSYNSFLNIYFTRDGALVFFVLVYSYLFVHITGFFKV